MPLQYISAVLFRANPRNLSLSSWKRFEDPELSIDALSVEKDLVHFQMAELGSGSKGTMEPAKSTTPDTGKNKEAADDASGSCSRAPSTADSDSVFDLDDDEDDSVYMSYGVSDEDDENSGGVMSPSNVETEGYTVFRIGIQASGDDDAYNKYNEYAFSKGFSIRKSNKVYSGRTGKLRLRRFVCAKEGVKKKNDPSAKGLKSDYRTDCKAHAYFKVHDDGVFVLWRFCDDHNHPFVPEGSRHHLRSHRRILKTSASMLNGLRVAGVGPSASYKVAADLAGGYSNVGFTRKDCFNHVTCALDKHYVEGDCQLMLDHFNIRQAQDPLFFYSIQCDTQNRMTNVFWRDGFAAQNYDHFGDVMVFDTTFKTNRYDMVCAPFVGVNNHWNNIFFGCAFMLVETIESFTWLLKTFRQSMGGVAPKTIFSDEDARIAAAIKEVFPESMHRLCIWNIAQNARQHVGRFYGVRGFKKAFLDLLYHVDDPDEFEEKWSKMLVDYSLEDNSWLGKVYRKKALWAPAYGRDVFQANMHSTQRSESANRVFKRLTTSTRTLTLFVEQYEAHNEYLREEERRQNFISFAGKPSISLPDVGILEHAAEVYTHTLFKRFQQEVVDSVAEDIQGFLAEPDGPVAIVSRGSKGKRYFVSCSRDLNSIKCSCKMFEFAGYMCRHAAKVMQHFRMKKIPSAYILRRWTMDLFYSQSLSMPHPRSGGSSLSRVNVVALQRLMRKCFSILNLCSENEESIKMAEQHLEDLDRECKTFRSENGLVAEHEVNEYTRNRSVRDPRTRSHKRRIANNQGRSRQRLRKLKRATALDDDMLDFDDSPRQGDQTSGPSTSSAFMFPPYSPFPPMFFGTFGYAGQPTVPNNTTQSSQAPDISTMSFTQLLSRTTGNLSQTQAGDKGH